MVLALLKAGFKEESIMEMPEITAAGYILIINELLSGSGRSKRYVVKRDAGKKQTK